MFLLDKMLVGGIRFVLDKVAVSVDRELNDDTALREELLAAQMRVELGEMTQEEFTDLEDRVLLRIREIREARGENMGAIAFGGEGGEEEGDRSWSAQDIAGITADFVADDFHEDLDGPAPSAPAAVVEAAVEPVAAPAPAAPRQRRKPAAGRKVKPAARGTKKRAARGRK